MSERKIFKTPKDGLNFLTLTFLLNAKEIILDWKIKRKLLMHSKEKYEIANALSGKI